MKHSHFTYYPKNSLFPGGKCSHRLICSGRQTTKFLDWKLFTAEVQYLVLWLYSTEHSGAGLQAPPQHKAQIIELLVGGLLTSPRGRYIVHKKNGECVGNERKEREKSACVGAGKTEREKRVRLQRQTVGEKEREVQFSTCFCRIRSTSIIMHQNNSFFFFPESVIMFHR